MTRRQQMRLLHLLHQRQRLIQRHRQTYPELHPYLQELEGSRSSPLR